MELLSRCSSSDRMSTLKRSRSFRASVKLMSKIRNHANTRLTAGFDLSISRDLKKERNLYVIEESRNSEKCSNLRKEDTNADIKTDKTGDEAFSNPIEILETNRKISMSENDTGSQEIAKDLKNKLSLTDKIMGKGRKDTERSSTKDENVKSPKVSRIFRRRRSVESSQGDTRGKNCNDKHVSSETDVCQPSKSAFYENPTFVLDNSLDSSVSSFLYEEEEKEEGKEEGKEEEQCQNCESERSVSCERDLLTVVVDSQKAAIKPRLICQKINYERDRYGDKKCVDELQNTFRSRECETDPLRCFCEGRSEEANAINGNRRTAESFGGFDRSRITFYCKVHETARKNASNCLQDQKFLDNVKTCPSKSCRIRTVDNFTNFWTSKRGNSFRSKMAVDRKRDAKEAKDYERVGRQRVLVSTSSGSSTLNH